MAPRRDLPVRASKRSVLRISSLRGAGPVRPPSDTFEPRHASGTLLMLPAVLGQPGAPLSILCLGAHCDDIEIGCGGTVLRLLAERPGSTVHWMAMSSTPEREREARAAATELLATAARSEVVIQKFRDGYLGFEGSAVKDFFEAT